MGPKEDRRKGINNTVQALSEQKSGSEEEEDLILWPVKIGKQKLNV